MNQSVSQSVNEQEAKLSLG